MIETIETHTVKILISCPGDVKSEKEEIIRVCKTFSNTNDFSKIVFDVIDWADYVGHANERLQGQLNKYIGQYHYYVGILWKRFGTPPDSKNSEGKINESGTEEEYHIALDRNKVFGVPKISFFIKKYGREANSLEENRQLTKVFEFIERQKPTNYLNFFESATDFNDLIIRWIRNIENSLLEQDQSRLKLTFTQSRAGNVWKQTELVVEPIIDNYIPRTVTLFETVVNKHTKPFIENERLTLVDVVDERKRIVLLGDAGSGKSTEVRNLFFHHKSSESPLIPIFQRLNSYTASTNLESFLPNGWQGIPESLLLIIWDGLDEIQPRDFNSTIRQIKNFSDQHPQARMVISCRTNFFELPINGSSGTLPDFTPFFIDDISIAQASDYYQRAKNNPDGEQFINSVYDANVIDLIRRPFFLMLLSEHYAGDKKLSLKRSELYKLFLENRIQLDTEHFKTTVERRARKNEIIQMLQKVALGMEILGKNHIQEEELLEWISAEEFESLKFFTAFKKEDGKDDVWQFEHNNIQEYLSALALSDLPFEKVIKFIAFDDDTHRMVPSWTNTVSFLFSIVPAQSTMFENLLNWFVTNQREVLVKFEPDKIDKDLRESLFQEIFNFYVKEDIWLRSNKFGLRELAAFGKSESNILFLSSFLEDSQTTRTVKLNAIQLIEYMQPDAKLYEKIKSLLLKEIESNTEDVDYLHASILALEGIGGTEQSIIEKLMKLLSERKNQYIRSAMYSILIESDYLEDYTDYVLEGFRIAKQNNDVDRSHVSLADETWKLKEAVLKIKTADGLKKVISFASEDGRFEYEYDSAKILNGIVKNSVKAYRQDTSLFDSFLDWFINDVRAFRTEKSNQVKQFFVATNTIDKAYEEILKIDDKDKERIRSLALAKLMTPELIQKVINAFLNHDITRKDIQDLYFELGWASNEHRELFVQLVHNQTDVKIQTPTIVDHEGIRKRKLQEDFDLMFDVDKFEEAVLEVFQKEGKDEIADNDLYEIRKDHRQWIDLEDVYSNAALRLLREMSSREHAVTIPKVKEWFQNSVATEYYRVSRIFETISEDVILTDSQEDWIREWCLRTVPTINFRKAIQVVGDRTTWSTKGIYIWRFSPILDVKYPKEILLDMLSFDALEDSETAGYAYVLNQLEEDEIVNRMLENLRNGIDFHRVLMNHVKYLCSAGINESYQLIVNEIVNPNMHSYYRRDYLKVFSEVTESNEYLKSSVLVADSELKWPIITQLIQAGEQEYVMDYLLKELKTSSVSADLRKSAEMLVQLGNLDGLDALVEIITKADESSIEEQNILCIKKLKDTAAIPKLIELLKYSYSKPVKVDGFYSLESQVLDSFYNIALQSLDNFKRVKKSLESFVDEYRDVFVDVKFIRISIDRMEEQFYMNYAKAFSVQDVRSKLKLLEG